MDNVNISVSAEVFSELEKLARPFKDHSPNDVIANLVEHYKKSPPSATGGNSQALLDNVLKKALEKPAVWRSSRGEVFPVGLKLRADFLGKIFEAEISNAGIEFNGKTYDNPSSAGIAAKHVAGKTGTAAAVNGWDFWEMQDLGTGRWVSINKLRSQ